MPNPRLEALEALFALLDKHFQSPHLPMGPGLQAEFRLAMRKIQEAVEPVTADFPRYTVYLDGNAWCATAPGFVDLQVSPSGFGESPVEALKNLLGELAADEASRCRTIRQWHCLCCSYRFGRKVTAKNQLPPCPNCSAGNQYVSEDGRRIEDLLKGTNSFGPGGKPSGTRTGRFFG